MISKVKGLVKAVGLSKTTTLVTFTRAMIFYTLYSNTGTSVGSAPPELSPKSSIM